MPGMPRILIVGGGYGGVAAAKLLDKKLGKNARITLVDRNPWHTLMTELHEVAAWRVEPQSVMVSFRRIFSGSRVELLTDEVKAIDFAAKKATLSASTLEYDYLVLGAGAQTDYFGIPGVKENSFELWSLDQALAIRAHIEAKWMEASREPDPARRRELLTFAVAGGGFTGIELAGELAEHRDEQCERFGIDPEEVSVTVVEALPAVLNMLDEARRAKAVAYMRKTGITLMLDSPIVKAEPGVIHLKDGRSLRAGTFVWTCGLKGSDFVAGLGLEAGKRGRIAVEPTMEAKGHPGVFVVGDGLWHLEEGQPLPQVVETALQTAETAARNIVADIKGLEKEAFRSDYHGYMVSVGSRFCCACLAMPKWTLPLVAVLGGLAGWVLIGFIATLATGWDWARGFLGLWNLGALGTAALAWIVMALLMKTSVFAMAMKHLVNLHYLWGIAGFNACWEYLKHEVFHRDDERGFWPARLVNRRVQGLWVTVLRVFTGFMWVLEGGKKLLVEKWLAPENSGWVNKLLFGIKPPAATEALSAASDANWEEGAQAVVEAAAPVADALSAASGAVAASGQTAVDALSAAKAAANAAGGQFLPALIKPLGIYTWAMKLVFGDGSKDPAAWQLALAWIGKTGIVLGEVAIGLALMGGAFTFLASGVSLVLCVLFVVSGMATREVLWFFFAGFTLLGASGRAVGLDHWILPFLGKRWSGTKLARRSKLYTGEPSTRRRKGPRA